ncbi:MAG: hypothetical protein ACK4L7_11035, partial [Flavobacteriales bacterium]
MSTEDIRRFRLLPEATYAIGPFGGQVKNGSLLLSPAVDQFYGNNAPGPYTLLHLAAEGGNAQQDSYRPWMNTGITFTGNRDHQYIGQKGKQSDYTDLVIHWSDNPGEWLKDRLRFIFTSGYDGNASTGAQSEEGLEFMRFWPNRYEDPHVGVGDFYAANLADPTITAPTERLDVVNGRVRIRQLPDDPAHEGSYKVMVVDDAAYPDDERGVVKWVNPNDLPGAADCDWRIENDGTSGAAVAHDVYTAVGTSDDCPDAADAVGIGIDLQGVVSPGKLAVATSGYGTAVHVAQNSAGASATGIEVTLAGATATTRGLSISATQGNSNAADNRGVSILATGSGNTVNTWNYGLHAEAAGGTHRSRGVYAKSSGAAFTGYGGYFEALDDASWTTGMAAYARAGVMRAGAS